MRSAAFIKFSGLVIEINKRLVPISLGITSGIQSVKRGSKLVAQVFDHSILLILQIEKMANDKAETFIYHIRSLLVEQSNKSLHWFKWSRSDESQSGRTRFSLFPPYQLKKYCRQTHSDHLCNCFRSEIGMHHTMNIVQRTHTTSSMLKQTDRTGFESSRQSKIIVMHIPFMYPYYS